MLPPSKRARRRTMEALKSISENVPTATGSQISSPLKARRQSVSPVMNPPPAARYQAVYPNNHHACTHHIMTRMYSTQFRCSVCFEPGHLGWLYRCAQDRELLLDDEWERGFKDKIDPICSLFDRPSSRPRSPESRMSRLAFLTEITDEQFKTYSPSQVTQVLEQRSHLLDVLNKATKDDVGLANSHLLSKSATRQSATSSETVPESAAEKPWLLNEECQYKICARCKPICQDRSYLSLDATVNGDIPATAVTAFGFGLLGCRPVVSADLMKNIGLNQPRQSPPPRSQLFPETTTNAWNTLGLGIFAGDEEPTSSNPLVPEDTRSSTSFQQPSPALVFHGSDEDPDKTPTQSSFSFSMLPPSNPWVPTLPHRPLFTHPNTSISLHLAHDKPLAHETNEEAGVTNEEARRPLTPMEKNESKEGKFGSLPLRVGDGVAVLEESVELHEADIITQC